MLPEEEYLEEVALHKEAFEQGGPPRYYHLKYRRIPIAGTTFIGVESDNIRIPANNTRSVYLYFEEPVQLASLWAGYKKDGKPHHFTNRIKTVGVNISHAHESVRVDVQNDSRKDQFVYLQGFVLVS
ncbi:MAG: hypothetical protein RhofKO_25630 [Rhodothermales bacterium]